MAWFRFGMAVVSCLAAGCFSTPRQRAPAFFPAPPEEPRLQFLTHYSDSLDVEPQPNRFYYFLTGAQPQWRGIVKPYGLALHDSKVFVCDTVLNVIDVFDLRARKFDLFAPSGAGQFGKPINMAIDADGTRYVADVLRAEVLVYSGEGVYAGAMGEKGSMKPVDVAVTSNRVYVADMKQRRIQVFDKATRKLLFAVPREPKNREEDLFGPTNLAIEPDGDIYVADSGAFRIQQYDSEGRYLRSLGQHGDMPGQFARPKGVAVDREGRLYCVDAATQVVQIFDPAGRLLLYFGEAGGSTAELVLPAKVIIDYDHVDLFQRYAAPGFDLEYLVLVSSQYGGRKIMVYGYGHRTAESAPVPVGKPGTVKPANAKMPVTGAPSQSPAAPKSVATNAVAARPVALKVGATNVPAARPVASKVGATNAPAARPAAVKSAVTNAPVLKPVAPKAGVTNAVDFRLPAPKASATSAATTGPQDLATAVPETGSQEAANLNVPDPETNSGAIDESQDVLSLKPPKSESK